MRRANVVNKKFLTYRNLVHQAFANVSNVVTLYDSSDNVFFVKAPDVKALNGFMMLLETGKRWFN